MIDASSHTNAPKTTAAPRTQIAPLTRAPRIQPRGPSPPSTDSSDVPVRLSRRGKPKVKTGCITCKIRRIKCDEAKPDCHRCTSTGRKCDGYVTPMNKALSQSNIDTQALALSKSIDWEQGSSAERRAINFFRCRTAPSVSSYFDSDFWTSLVLQVSQREPAVRHALVAVGALNERRDLYVQDLVRQKSIGTSLPNTTELSEDSSSETEQEQHNDPFALTQYNKAIKHVAQIMSNPSPEAVDTALLVCILFVCVECLRGDYKPALKHYQAGMSIAIAAAGKASPNSRASQATGVRDKLIPFFNRLELLGQVYGQNPPYDYGLSPPEAVPSLFTSIVEARNSIVHIMNLSIRHIRRTNIQRSARPITAEDTARHNALLTALGTWSQNLTAFLAAAPPSPRLTEAATILRIQALVAQTWLHRSAFPTETATDADIPLYEHAVLLAESLQTSQHRDSISTAPTFLFDMELISPLYLVALKCRHPLIRRRAITVLRRYVRREGLWDSLKVAAIAERVVEIEEVGLGVRDGSEMPAEGRRISFAHIETGAGLNPSGHKVSFCRKVGGGWEVWDEWVVVR